MAKKTIVAGNPEFDATLPDVSLELDGQTYHLCFDYSALSLAERKLAAAGKSVNMLSLLDLRELGAERLPILFFASLLKQHPKITFPEVEAMVTMRSYALIFEKVVDAYLASVGEVKPEEKQDDPIQEPVLA